MLRGKNIIIEIIVIMCPNENSFLKQFMNIILSYILFNIFYKINNIYIAFLFLENIKMNKVKYLIIMRYSYRF